MVDSYNTIAAETIADHTTCEMKAVRGDLSHDRGPPYLISDPSVNFGEFDDFDLIAMCVRIVLVRSDPFYPADVTHIARSRLFYVV
jgi:hypothetical protein